MSLIKKNGNSFFPNITPHWEDFFGRDIMEMAGWKSASSIPAVNIEEKPQAFEVTLAAPA